MDPEARLYQAQQRARIVMWKADWLEGCHNLRPEGPCTHTEYILRGKVFPYGYIRARVHNI